MWQQNAEVNVEDICRCGRLTTKKTSWTDLNPGRRYAACERFREVGGCSYFEWIDPLMCDRAWQIIPGLLRRANRLQDELKRLEDEEKMKASREKWLWLALVFSWTIMYLFW
ncbi:hypothetical protein DH2020_015995 [Rehmannia glutinosa]|uniref:GRF-type domain-containing protein n=1 Tax=Rehmannia glutinosa TaxID=99300 RepID=A0ABR0WU82_REHGL